VACLCPNIRTEQTRKTGASIGHCAGISEWVKNLAGGSIPILYGGSVNQQNCIGLASQSHIDGLFIGGATWDVKGYIGIINSVMEAEK
jgi:triosephosphate isomerase